MEIEQENPEKSAKKQKPVLKLLKYIKDPPNID